MPTLKVLFTGIWNGLSLFAQPPSFSFYFSAAESEKKNLRLFYFLLNHNIIPSKQIGGLSEAASTLARQPISEHNV